MKIRMNSKGTLCRPVGHKSSNNSNAIRIGNNFREGDNATSRAKIKMMTLCYHGDDDYDYDYDHYIRKDYAD